MSPLPSITSTSTWSTASSTIKATSSSSTTPSSTATYSSLLSVITSSSVSSSSEPTLSMLEAQAPSLSFNSTNFGKIPENENAKHEQKALLVLIILILVALVVAMFFYLWRKSRLAARRRRQKDEEERLEAAEARAFMSVDEALKRAYSPSLLFGGEEEEIDKKPLATLPKAHINERVGFVPHPLFHPGIKQSRTLPTGRDSPFQKLRPTQSYPLIIKRQMSIVSPISSFVSRGSYYQSQPSLSIALTTMQTQRPGITPIRIQERQSAPITIYLDRPMKSAWSSPTASIAPSSPSTYSYAPLTPRHVSLRPAPTLSRESPSSTNTKVQSPSPQHFQHAGSYPLLPLDRELNLPPSTFVSPEKFMTIMESHDLSTQPSRPLTYSPASSPLASPRISSPAMPTDITLTLSEPKATLTPETWRPSLAELNAMNEDPAVQSSLGLEPIDNEIKIERWLDGSTGTACAFGSILGIDELVKQAAAPVSRLSPIKSMRPTSQRRRSKPDSTLGEGNEEVEHFIGAAF